LPTKAVDRATLRAIMLSLLAGGIAGLVLGWLLL
jgi:hypothetical protein